MLQAAIEHSQWPAFVRCTQQYRHHLLVVGHASRFVSDADAESVLLVQPYAIYRKTLAECPEMPEVEDTQLDATMVHPCHTKDDARCLLQQGMRHGGRWVCVDPARVWEAYLWHLPLWGPSLADLRNVHGDGPVALTGKAAHLLGESVGLNQPLPEAMEAALSRHALQELLLQESTVLPPSPQLLLPPADDNPGSPLLTTPAARVTVLAHGRNRRSDELHQELRDLRCHATVRQKCPALTTTDTCRKQPSKLPPYPVTSDLLEAAIRQTPHCQAYLEALHKAVPGAAAYPEALLPAVQECRQQLRQVAQDATILAHLQDPHLMLARVEVQGSIPALPSGLLRISTPELYPPLRPLWETLADWMQRQKKASPVVLLMLYLHQRHDPGTVAAQQCAALVHRVMGAEAAAPFVQAPADPQAWQDLCPDASWPRIQGLLDRLMVHLQHSGIVYLIRLQEEGEVPCCHPAVLPLTVELETPPPRRHLPGPPPPQLAAFLPEFAPVPDDLTLLFTPHGFTVRRLAGLAGDALQALWVYAFRELQKVRPAALQHVMPAAGNHRTASRELTEMYNAEKKRLALLQALQANADVELEQVSKAFLDAYGSYQESSAELRQQQEILVKLNDQCVLPPLQPFCHHSSLLARLQRKMQWGLWFGQQQGQLTCMPYSNPQLQRWYTQACMCQLSDERQSSRTVTQHPDGTTVQHEAHSHRRVLQWKMQMLPELLHMTQDAETHYVDHQFRIKWLEYLLHSLHNMHKRIMEEQYTLKRLIWHLSDV